MLLTPLQVTLNGEMVGNAMAALLLQEKAGTELWFLRDIDRSLFAS